MVLQLKSMKGQRVLITGGLGFIGSNLAAKCLQLEASVTIFTHSLEKTKNINDFQDNVKIIQGDITSYSDIESSIKGMDIIFHLAAQTSHTVAMENPIQDIEINLFGTMNVLEACRKSNQKAKIISVGTITQLGIAKKLPIKGDELDFPIELYSANKLICEKYFQIYHKSYGMYTSFLRLGTIFGERQALNNPRRGITNIFIGQIMRNQPITVYGDGKFIRDYVHIDDVVSALILCSQNEKAKGQSFLIGANPMQFIEMVEQTVKAVEKITNKQAKITFVPFPENQKKLDAGDIKIDYSKIRNLLGWEPSLNFKQGIEQTISYYHDKWEDYL